MTDRPLPVAQVGDLDVQTQQQQWLIQGLWGRSAIGLIGGAPKCCKSWLGLDMALSVASGTPALGHFPVQHRGPALVYLAEDALPQVRARIQSLCRHRQLDIHQLDLHAITASTLRLDLASDQQRLADTLAQFKPHLLLLDPLVRLHRLDENSASDISGLLGYIRDLQRRFDVAIVLVHHASKKQRAQPGQALRGSSDLHAIGDSNAYLARKNRQLILSIEHRAAAAPEPLAIELVVDPDDQRTHLRLCHQADNVTKTSEPSLDQQVLQLLASQDQPLSRATLRDRLRVNNDRLGKTLLQLEQLGRLNRGPNGWRVNARYCRLPGETEAGAVAVQPAKG